MEILTRRIITPCSPVALRDLVRRTAWACVAKDTWKYIKKRCIDALRLVPELEGDRVLDAKKIQLLAEVHREVEFQWIRMFHLQGGGTTRVCTRGIGNKG